MFAIFKKWFTFKLPVWILMYGMECSRQTINISVEDAPDSELPKI